MEITIKNNNQLDGIIKRVISGRIEKVFVKGEFLLTQQAEILKQKFAKSEEFVSLKGRLKGEFGFTDEEVANLDRVLDLLVPGNNQITISKIETGPSKFALSLDWVNLEELKVHEYAQHELTKLSKSGAVVAITDIISWVEWLEEGVTIRGFRFFRPDKLKKLSRSGEGLMTPKEGSIWTFKPTRILENIAASEKGNFITKGFGILVKKLVK